MCCFFVACSGDDGSSTLTSIETLAAGDECAAGGARVSAGQDDNGNGTLDASEVESSTVVCTGASGADGSNGADGMDGVGALVELNPLAPSEECPFGGTTVVAGADTNGSGTLDPDEVSSTQSFCDTELEAFDGLLFASSTVFGGEPALYQVGRSGPPIRRDAPRSASGTLQGPLRSPDGRWAAYLVSDLLGGVERFYRTIDVLTLERPFDGFREVAVDARFGVQFSPDSNRILYRLDELGTPRGLASGRTDGTLGVELVEPAGSLEVDGAAFSADSQRIAFTADLTFNNSLELVLVDTDGGGSVSLPLGFTASDEVSEFEWSPVD
ncbi:MAG: hypothetical protein AAF658_21820, partial [Myxococcota bacterium]